jgi:hypothetical protein
LDAEVASGAEVAGGSVTGGAVTNGAMVAVGVGIRELHEQAMITIPATAPINTSQNFLRTSMCFLLSEK